MSVSVLISLSSFFLLSSKLSSLPVASSISSAEATSKGRNLITMGNSSETEAEEQGVDLHGRLEEGRTVPAVSCVF
jgi:hypothetical protein